MVLNLAEPAFKFCFALYGRHSHTHTQAISSTACHFEQDGRPCGSSKHAEVICKAFGFVFEVLFLNIGSSFCLLVCKYMLVKVLAAIVRLRSLFRLRPGRELSSCFDRVGGGAVSRRLSQIRCVVKGVSKRIALKPCVSQHPVPARLVPSSTVIQRRKA